MAKSVPDRFDFPKEEERILKLWKDINAFQKSLKLSKGRPRYSFYDGPPFATGLPHYGHILAGTIKDTVTRWAAMNGYYVERRFGWDCHGLPVEYEIDKKLGIKSPEQVMQMGIKAYNKECRKIVMRYAKEWEEIVTRCGRWIDFENDYKTMYPEFMESVWWVFKQLYESGMVYKGFKVMPFSTGCNTPLSNFESGQNYKDVSDPAVIVTFPILPGQEIENASLLAWTTTPWTLPSNLSLCVNPEEVYVMVADKETGSQYILMEKRIVALYSNNEAYEVLNKFIGLELVGLSYEPLFSYFAHRHSSGAFRVLQDGYVTDSSGTGVVHQAPYFGEDDYRVCLANEVISKDGEIACPVDESGKFIDPVTDYLGQYVKDADKQIIKDLKARGRMINHRTCNHSYPFCWRSETPLIYKAVPSWFVRVEKIVSNLLENNSKTYWVPEFVKEKRFANWLRDARDWAVSRNRYWGTPIPLWISEDSQEVVCVGSIAELEELSGQKFTDIHRESVDDVTIPSRCGKGELRRVTEVFDCWFESGSMPYAQQHYPFERKKEFEESFPADFIAEGVDQTRGWFYTLLVLSTSLFGTPPFKNLICNGLILASDGTKMSKRKKNYPEPQLIMDAYGADATRLYLINSPAVRGDTLKFKEQGVKDVVKDMFLPWFNAYRFLMQNIERLGREEGVEFKHDEATWKLTGNYNYMDRWILSFTQSLIKFVRQEMAAYRLYTVMPQLVKFVDNLTNWYVRMNRRRLKGDNSLADCKAALETLFIVIYSMVKVMAPFTPFLSENFYQTLSHCIVSGDGERAESVHFLSVPLPREELIDVDIERTVARMQAVIELGRVIRDRKTLPVKFPLKEVVVVQEDEQYLRDVNEMRSYITEELNVKTLTTTGDKAKYGVRMKAQADQKILGAKLKSDFKAVALAVSSMTDAEIGQLQEQGSMEVQGHCLELSEIRISYEVPSTAGSNYEPNGDQSVMVLIDCTVDESAESEGLAREVTNRIQRLRKEAGLQPNNDVTVYYETSQELATCIARQYELIFSSVKQPLVAGRPKPAETVIITSGDLKVKTFNLVLTLTTRGSTQPPPNSNSCGKAAAKFCNVVCNGKQGTLLLENPVGSGNFTSYGGLCAMVRQLFKQLRGELKIYHGTTLLSALTDSSSLHGVTLSVGKPEPASNSSAVCQIGYLASESETVAIVMENPKGENKLSEEGCNQEVRLLMRENGDQLRFFTS